MSELDEAATLTWIEMDEMQPIDSQHSKLNFARSRDFKSVRVAALSRVPIAATTAYPIPKYTDV